MFLDLGPTDLSLLVRGLTELLHGDMIPETEWAGRMGEPRAAAEALLARLGQAHSDQLLSGTGAMQDLVLAGFGGAPPTESQVAELTEAAIGPANAVLRAALQHYALLRALGPVWLDELTREPAARAAIPAPVWMQLQQFLGGAANPGEGGGR